MSRGAQMIMCVCTGAFILAEAGLLVGKDRDHPPRLLGRLAVPFPKVTLVRGPRFVEHERLATAGGLTSGIDLALRAVERCLGRKRARATARYLEYQA